MRTTPTAAFVLVVGLVLQVKADGELVKFPETFADGVLYATVTRGALKE